MPPRGLDGEVREAPLPDRYRHRRRRPRRRLAQLGAVIVAVVSVAYLGASVVLAARTTASLTTPQLAADQAAGYRQQVCLTKAVHREVPKGATVYVEPNADSYVTQLLTQKLTLWAVPVTNRGSATWLLSLSSTSGQLGCGGLQIHAERRR